MTDSIRRASVGRPIRLEQYREWIMFAATIVVLVLVVVLSVKNLGLQKDLARKESGLYRTELELVSGVKRFMDRFYSVNSGTVREDQFRAVNMLVDPQLQLERTNYLAKHEIVRKAERAKIRSELDWNNGYVKSLGNGEKPYSMIFECKVKLITYSPGKNTHLIDVVITVIPVEKKDTNTEGVGVIAFSDLAYDPFAKGVLK